MVSQDVIDFIKGQREEGTSDEEIFRALNVIGGWDKEDFDDAVREIEALERGAATPAPTPMPSVTETTTVQTTQTMPVAAAPFEMPAAPMGVVTPAAPVLTTMTHEVTTTQTTPAAPIASTWTPPAMPEVAIPTPVAAPIAPVSESPFTANAAAPISVPAVDAKPATPFAANLDTSHPTFGISLANMAQKSKGVTMAPGSAAPAAPAPVGDQTFASMYGAAPMATPAGMSAPLGAPQSAPEISSPSPFAAPGSPAATPAFSYVPKTEMGAPMAQAPAPAVSAWPTQPIAPQAPAAATPSAGGYVNPNYGADLASMATPGFGRHPSENSGPAAAAIPGTQPPTTPTGPNYKKIITFIFLLIAIGVAGYFFVKSQEGMASTLMSKISFLNNKDRDFLKSVSNSKLFSKYPAMIVKTNFTGVLTLKSPTKESFAALMGVSPQMIDDQQKISYTATRDLVRFGSTHHEHAEGELTIGSVVIPFEMVKIDPVLYIRRTDEPLPGQTHGIGAFPSNVWFMIDPRHFDDLQFDSVKIASFTGDALPALFKKMLKTLDKQGDNVNIAKSDANPNRVQFVYDGALATTVDKFTLGDWIQENFGSAVSPSLTKGLTDLMINEKVSNIEMGVDESTNDPLTLSYKTSWSGSQTLGMTIDLTGTVSHTISSRLQSTNSMIDQPGAPTNNGDERIYQLLRGEAIVNPVIPTGPQKPGDAPAAPMGDTVIDVIGALTRNRQSDLDNQIQSNLSKVTSLANAYKKEKKTYAGMCQENQALKLIINDTKNMSDSLTCDDGETGYRVTVASVKNTDQLYCISDKTKKVIGITSPEEPYTFNCKSVEVAADTAAEIKQVTTEKKVSPTETKTIPETTVKAS
ncbi:MAG TPA: hypothetical protein VGE63_03590 [Candidatus Paceibacterota bacterium]